MQSLCPVFSTDRMVQEYTTRCYLPAFENWSRLAHDNLALATDLARWKEKIGRLWHQVRVEEVVAEGTEEVSVGDTIPVRAKVFLGDIPLDAVSVESYCGVLDSRGAIVGGELVPLAPAGEYTPGGYHYTGAIECRFCGRHGFLLRVMPRHPELGVVYEPGILLWG